MSECVQIRRYEAKDWAEIADLHDRARLDELRLSVGTAAFIPLADAAEPEGLFEGELWVAAAADAVRGFVAVSDDEITWLYVDPAFARRGIGRRLLLHAIERCQGRTVRTSVLQGNAPALALYEQEGFRIVKTITGSLAGNEQFPAVGHQMERVARQE